MQTKWYIWKSSFLLFFLATYPGNIYCAETDWVPRKKFRITADRNEICIYEKDADHTLSIKPPLWLRKKANIKRLIKISRDNRYFIIAAHDRYSVYTLDHEIWKPGHFEKGGTLEEPIPIMTAYVSDPYCRFDTNQELLPGEGIHYFVTLTYQYRGEIIAEERNLPNTFFTGTPKERFAVSLYARCASKGLLAAKYLACKTNAFHPCAPLPPQLNNLKQYRETFLKFKRRTEKTELNRAVIERVCELISKAQSDGKKINYAAIAQTVCRERYAALLQSVAQTSESLIGAGQN